MGLGILWYMLWLWLALEKPAKHPSIRPREQMYIEKSIGAGPGKNTPTIMTTPWVELGGSCKISCPQSGYSANIEFKRKPFWGAEYNKVTAEILPPGGKKNIVKVSTV